VRAPTREIAWLGAALTAAAVSLAACSSEPAASDVPDEDEPKVADGTKDGDETDVDCGGSSAPKCGLGKTCTVPADCESDTCENGVCAPPSDVGKGCTDGAECASKVCDPVTSMCAAPTFDDGVKNGGETDVDCGGPDAGPRCAAGKACEAHSDCASDGCAYDKKCATAPSCTKLEGGYTCGPTETAARQEDCCASAPVGGYVVDKFQVTAGRMRVFLERLNGNVRGWAQGLPAARWDQTYTSQLPQSWDEANVHLGPYYDKRSCTAGYHTGHTFRTPPQDGDMQAFPQEVLDAKALNGVPW